MRIKLSLFAVLAVLVISTALQAQTKPKFGHLDFATLYRDMPGQDSIRVVFEDYARTMQETFTAMQSEYERKLRDYQDNMATMSTLIRQTRERELIDIQSRMENFRVQAEEDLAAKELELTAPLIEKARQAVRDVAVENGFTYIFNSAEGLLLYAEPADDILPLVKKRLGII